MRLSNVVHHGVMAGLTFALLLLPGCKPEGCLGGGAGCKLPTPCASLRFACTESADLDIRVLKPGDARPGGLDALGANGDVLLQSGKVSAVISAIGNQNYLDINGGALIDLAIPGKHNDGLSELFQVIGILPGDEFRYTSLQVIDERPTRVAVQLRGTLEGHPDIPVSTLYELRPCEPGLRIRTEIVNDSPDPQLFFTADGFYWSGNEPLPFTPNAGAGFIHPSFGLTTINGAFQTFPLVAASLHSMPAVSYGLTSCTQSTVEGFNSAVVSAVGMPRRIVQPRDSQVYERFLAVADSEGVAGAIDTLLGVRTQLWKEATLAVSGKVALPHGLAVNSEREVSILFSEGTLVTPLEKRVPWSEVVPRADGTFSLRLPAKKSYVLEVHAFGRKVVEKELTPASDTDLGTLILPGTAQLTLNVNTSLLGPIGERAITGEVFVVPADPATAGATTGSFYGQYTECAPYLGLSQGSSPACNRVLVPDGKATGTPGTTVEVPFGHYFIYAFHGPFWTLAREEITLDATHDASLTFRLHPISVEPPGTVGADLHVHGAASFDSSLPDLDRVLSFDASGLSVLVATDHDVVHDYTPIIKSLGMEDRMTCISGVETTGHVPYLAVPGDPFPRVIGHYNFWPLTWDPLAPRGGGPYDEFIEPGALYDRIVAKGLFSGPVPVMQLNHPWANSDFGRDLGFPRALGLNTLLDLPANDDGTNAGVYVRRAAGGTTNDGQHAQEVINGTSVNQMLQYRAFWFFMLNQGKLKTGTANSDSHSLTDNTVGVPRNLVFADTAGGAGFDVNLFNQAIRDGRLLGTNGPVIEATLDGADGKRHPYGLAPFAPDAAGKLHLKISAAPWVPVEEVRVIVNGKLVHSFGGLSSPGDPFGTAGAGRFEGDIALANLLPAQGDAWLVVEAGAKLPLAGDLSGERGVPDGIPDTSDNNGDGKVDALDVTAGKTSGTLNDPAVPTSDTDPRFHYAHVLNGGYPYAFTNPFVLDRNGNGVFDAPGVKGAR